MSDHLVQTFLQHIAQGLQPAFAEMLDLSQRLQALVLAGTREWPTLGVEPAHFIRYLASRLPDGKAADEVLGALRAGDLYLTCACAAGHKAAISAFDQKFMGEIDIALGRMRMTRDQVDDVKQLVRQKLFVSSDGRPGKIVDYSGRGDLRRWVRSIAVRTCLNEIRKKKPQLARNESDELLMGQVSDSSDDPEMAYLRERYSREFKAAFIEALGSLNSRQQNLLRYHHIDRLNIDEIGAIYRVHRVTAFRWLEGARKALVETTHKLLRAQLNIEHGELDSIMRLIQSQIHVSIIRYLGDLTPGDDAGNLTAGGDAGDLTPDGDGDGGAGAQGKAKGKAAGKLKGKPKSNQE